MRTLGNELKQDLVPKMDYVVCTKNDVNMIEECIRGIHKIENKPIWSSAYNPEVVGSNPTPSTKIKL